MRSDAAEILKPGRVLNGRYLLLEPIRQSQGVSTWLGIEKSSGKPVVIKTAVTAALGGDRLMRLEREALVLKELEDPGLARFLELGSEEGLTWLALGYVPGETLETRLGRGPLSFQDTLAIGKTVLEALVRVHDRGVLHRDIKPSNLVVSGEGRVERVTLIDFGLARSEQLDSEGVHVPAGTARYMAPEQSRVIDRQAGPWTDLFSLGAVLYECLAGRPLFPGEKVGEVLRQQLASSSPPTGDSGVELPRAFEKWLRICLRTEPEERYGSAATALAALRAAETAATRGEDLPELATWPSLRGPRVALRDPEFVGREAELECLRNEWEQARLGRGGVLLLEGESGGGKTRLLREFSKPIPWVLRGQAVDQATQGPFRILSGVAEGMLARARKDAELRNRLRLELEPFADAICEVLPVCEELFGRRQPRGWGPENLGEIRSIQALAAFLDALGDHESPCLVILDDCQWADDLSLRLISFYQRKPGEAAGSSRYGMLIAAFRSEEVGPEHRLRGLTHFTSIRLRALGAEECRRLAESMAGKLPPEGHRAVTLISQGNPFMASAILHGLVESGALLRGGSGWMMDAEALPKAQPSRKAGIFLARRLKGFPAKTLRVLSVGAVIGKEFGLEAVTALAGLSQPEARAALSEACLRKVAWPEEDGVTYAFVHDKIRETLLELMDPAARSQLHLDIARYLVETAPDRRYDLAYHYSEAGRLGEAFPYALGAALQSRDRHALHVSERYFRIAEKGAGYATPAQRLQIAEGLGDVLMLLGRYEEAGAFFDQALKRATDAGAAVAVATIKGKIGELRFKQGKVDEAAAALEDALRALSVRVPGSGPGYCLAAVLAVLVQALHSVVMKLWPKLWLARRDPARGEGDFLRARLLSRLAYVNWFGKGKIPCLWAHLREMNLVERYPESVELAQAYSEHAPVMTMVPWFSRGVEYAERSLEIRTRLGDIWGQGQSSHFYGVVLYGASRFEQSIERCETASRLLERTGDRWEVNTASWHIAYARYRLGDLRGAIERARSTYRAAMEIGDHQAAGISLSCWAKATAGRVPAELLRPELALETGDRHTRIEVLQAEAIRLLGTGSAGDAARAVALLERAQEIVDRSGFKQEYVAPVLPWLATSLRTRLYGLAPHRHEERRRLLRAFRKASRRALRISRQYRNNLPHSLREAAYLAACLGKSGRARALLRRSLAEARSQGARYEEALSLQAYGEIGVGAAWADAEELGKQGRLRLASFESEIAAGLAGRSGPQGRPETPSLSLWERFASLLATGRKIATALSKKDVFDAVCEAALSLLRAENCVVLELPEIERSPDVSHRLVEEAVRSLKPVVYSDQQSVNPSESIILSDARSALCAPITLGGKVAACFYVTHRHVGGLFGDDELRIAEFIAALAGAALENAEGFARVEGLSEERRRLHAEAQQAVRFRDEFLSLASHELRTPLTSLKLQLHLVSRKSSAAEGAAEARARFVDVSRKQIERLSQLVDDLLDVSRLSVGRFTLSPEPTELGALIREVLDRFQADLLAAGCAASVIRLDPVRANVDPVRFEQVVINLLTNAMKYAKGAPLEIDLHEQGGKAVLRVRDHGPGIEPSQQGRIFQRFERAVPAGEASGLGLGLYIASEIAKAHGGAIRVESELGRGAEFVVELPVLLQKRLTA